MFNGLKLISKEALEKVKDLSSDYDELLIKPEIKVRFNNR